MAQNGRLGGKVVLVTGGGSGIGRATALRCAEDGASIVVVDQNVSGATVAKELTELGAVATSQSRDISDPDDVQAMVREALESFGHLDVLVNNAGVGGSGQRLHELSIEEWDRTIAVNLRGQFLCAKFIIPLFLQSGGGAIVNVASTYGITGAPRSPEYCASKGGVVALTRQLAVDYGSDGIRINAVCPGYINTDMGGRRAALGPAGAAAANAAREAHAALQPLGRQADAREVANVIAFLASEESSFMTGSIVTVDGGCTATFNHGLPE